MKSAQSIAFDYWPSARLAASAAIVTVFAVLAAFANDLPLPARTSIAAAAIAAGIVFLPRFLRPRFRRIAYRSSGWTGVDRAGEESLLALRAHVRLGAWLALDFEATGRRRFRAILGPDNLDAETRRRLIVLLARAEIARAA